MELFDFIEKSPEAYHTVMTLEEEFSRCGFRRLKENEIWKLETGGKYYVVRGDTSLFAFQIPANWKGGFHIVAAHTDSPAFKVKENPEITVENHYVKLDVEKYGGMLIAPWFDRPLSVAGRVMLKKGTSCESRLYNADRDLLVIPNLAIHMNRKANDGYTYQVSKDLCPLFAQKGSIREMIAEELGVSVEDILGTDLYLYNRMKGTVLGMNGEFIAAPRLDDLQCVYAAMKAFLSASSDMGEKKAGSAAATAEGPVKLFGAFDSEEVGSGTRQGAGSDFLYSVLRRISESMGKTEVDYHKILADSFLISADNAHGAHPNFPEKADEKNRPYLNGGIVIKYNGSGKYITDSVSASVFKLLCERAGVSYQEYFNHSDIAGGSTLGHIAAQRVSVRGVDIGLAELAMHSPYETAGARDTEDLIKVLELFYRGNFREKEKEENGVSVYSI